MDKFIEILKQFESEGSVTHDENDVIVNKEIEEFAIKLLISESGQCNWDNINILKNNGFIVVPIEKDRFGWLIGGILTKNGIITYG